MQTPPDRQAGFQVEDAITVYVLFDEVFKELYVGMTNNFERRFHEHRTGQNKSTQKYQNLKAVYAKSLPNYALARKHEKYLKSASGKRFIKKHYLQAGIV